MVSNERLEQQLKQSAIYKHLLAVINCNVVEDLKNIVTYDT